MRFIDLKPEFVQSSKSGENRKGTAVWSLCPCGCGSGLLIALRNPLDGGPPDGPEVWGEGLTDRWQRTGEDFNTISFEPSVLMWEDKKAGKQHWHGWIRNGEVTA
jgi:hypothetical protein